MPRSPGCSWPLSRAPRSDRVEPGRGGDLGPGAHPASRLVHRTWRPSSGSRVGSFPGRAVSARSWATRFDLPAIGRARGLTAREMEILELMIDGRSYKEIESGAPHLHPHGQEPRLQPVPARWTSRAVHQLIHRIGVYGGENGPARSV
ncbi:MAG: hypothetical protein MZV64_13335 [Ignavibacteriales bacterium]|nr:hypothetical protein [Ignavibacteriales bacterium]